MPRERLLSHVMLGIDRTSQREKVVSKRHVHCHVTKMFISFYTIKVYLFTSMQPACQLNSFIFKKIDFENYPNNISFFPQGTAVNPARRQSRKVICLFSAWWKLVVWLSVMSDLYPAFPKRDFVHSNTLHRDHLISPKNCSTWYKVFTSYMDQRSTSARH